MDYRTEKMRREDKAAVTEMMETFYLSDAVLTDGSPDIFNNDIEACIGENPFAEGYVFKEGENILGYAMIAKSYSTEFGKSCIWLEDLYIKPPYRGLGIGSAFIKKLFSMYPEAAFRLEAEKKILRRLRHMKNAALKLCRI